jgi:hypothetical protein
MQQWEMGLSNGMGNVVYRELIPDDATVTYFFRLQKNRDRNLLTPFFITPTQPEVPTFSIGNLNGDISGQIGVNNANPSLIVQKPELTIGSLKSSEIVINAVEDSLDVSELSKTTPKALFNAWAVKTTPIAADKLVIIDSEDSDELKISTGLPLTMLDQGGATDGQAIVWNDADGVWEAGTVSGSKWTEVANGIYRDGRVVIGDDAVGTDYQFRVVGNVLFENEDVFGLVTRRNISSGTDTIYTVYSLDGNKSTAPGNGFEVAMRLSIQAGDEPLGTLSAQRTGASGTGAVRIGTYNSGGLAIGLVVQENRGVWIGSTTVAQIRNAEASSLQVSNRIRTAGFSGTTSRYWKLGERKSATVLLDTTKYITVEVDGTIYNLALATV